MESLGKGTKLRKTGMRFGTWNLRSLHRVGSLMTIAKELLKCKLYVVGMQDVRWDTGGTEPAREY
jgi:hypothetical protein